MGNIYQKILNRLLKHEYETPKLIPKNSIKECKYFKECQKLKKKLNTIHKSLPYAHKMFGWRSHEDFEIHQQNLMQCPPTICESDKSLRNRLQMQQEDCNKKINEIKKTSK